MDYVLCDHKIFKPQPRTVYSSPLYNSDHRLVCVDLEITIKPWKRKMTTHKPPYDRVILPSRLDAFQVEMERKLPDLCISSIDMMIAAIKEAASVAAPMDRRVHKPWITPPTIELCRQRAILRDQGLTTSEYRELNKRCRTAINFDKKVWETIEIAEIAAASVNHDQRMLYASMNAWTFRKGIKPASATSAERLAQTFCLGPPKLLRNPDIDIELESRCGHVEDITTAELRQALKCMKSGRACGPDEIGPEALLALADDSLQLLVNHMNEWLQGADVPSSVTAAHVVPVAKGKTPAAGFRPISLLNTSFKAYETVISNRIRPTLIRGYRSTQAGFCPGRSVGDHIHSILRLIEHRNRYQAPFQFVFLDVRKAYDSVDLEAAWSWIMADKSLPIEYVRAIRNLFRESQCQIRVNGSSTTFQRQLGIPQGSVLSPAIFNLIISHILNETMKDAPQETIDFLYADDTTLGVLSADDQLLQTLTNKFMAVAKEVNLQINPAKSQILHRNCRAPVVNVDGTTIPVVASCKYLGVILRADSSTKDEIKARVESAQRAYFGMYKFFSNRNVAIKTKLQVYESTVRSILLYQCGTWSGCDESVAVFDRQCLRRIVRGYTPPNPSRGVNYWRCWSNRQMMKATGLLEIEIAVAQARARWAGHVSRMKRNYARDVMEIVTKPIDGCKRKPGGQKRVWMEQVMIDMDKGKIPMANAWKSIQTQADDRDRWRKMVANVGA